MAAILTDFGLAKSAATGSKYTRTGQALGTPAYMSPEQARGAVTDLTAATDVWSLGCVLWELLAGESPFAADTPAATIGRILTEPPPRLRTARRDAPGALEAVLQVALAKSAGDRYPSARELREELDRVLRGERVTARPDRRPRVAVAAIAVAGAVAVAVSVRGPGADATGHPPRPTVERSDAEAHAAVAWERRGTDPAGAAVALAAALVRAPDRHDWRVRLGLLHWILGDGAKARGAWAAVPDGTPSATAARLYLGLEAFFALDRARATPLLTTVAGGTGPEARLAAAALRVVDDRWADARAALVGASGWEAALLRAYVESFDPAGDLSAAVRAYTDALDGGPPLAWVYYNRGACRARLGDHAGDVLDCTEALRLRPGYRDARVNRGVSRADIGDDLGAVEDLTAALALGPDIEAYLNRGLSREALGDPVGARTDYDAAIVHDPTSAVAWFTRGRLAERQGDDAGAIPDLDEALRRQATHAPSLILRGQIGARRKEFTAALADLDAAVAALPGDGDAFAQRGIIRGQAGNVPGALADLTESLRLRPGDAETLVNRGIARSILEDDAGALADYEAAVRADPGFARAHASLALARVNAGDLQGGLEAAETALRLTGDGPQGASLRAVRDRLRVELGLEPAGR